MKHCCTEASPEEVELEAEEAKPEFVAVAAGLERGPHFPKV